MTIKTSPFPEGSVSLTMYCAFVITDSSGNDVLLTQEGDQSNYYWDDQQHQVLRPKRLRLLADTKEPGYF